MSRDRMISVRVDESTAFAAEELAAKDGIPLSVLLRQLLIDYIRVRGTED